MAERQSITDHNIRADFQVCKTGLIKDCHLGNRIEIYMHGLARCHAARWPKQHAMFTTQAAAGSGLQDTAWLDGPERSHHLGGHAQLYCQAARVGQASSAWVWQPWLAASSFLLANPVSKADSLLTGRLVSLKLLVGAWMI